MRAHDPRGKVIARVLTALEAGMDRSIDIAAALDEPLSNVSGALLSLYCCGVVERQKVPPRGEGRPPYRYRLRGASCLQPIHHT